MKKKLLLLLLSLATIFVFVPATAFAADDNVAEYNGKGYTTLRAAFEAAADPNVSGGDITVKVTADITKDTFSNASSKNIALGEGEYILDLNGHNVTAENEKALSLYGTKLTIKDSSAEQTGTLSNKKSPAATLVLWNSRVNADIGADVTFESGNIVTKGYAVYLGGSSTFTLKDGTIISKTNTTIQIEGDANGATVNVEGGVVDTNDGQNAIQNWGKNSTINVSGGQLGHGKTDDNELGALNFAICSRNYTDPSDTSKVYSSEGAKITITGGVLTGNQAIEMQPGTLYIRGTNTTPVLNGAISVGGQYAVGVGEISGGQFNGNLLARKNGRFVISGGTFNKGLTAYTAQDNNGVDYSRAGKYSLKGGTYIEDVSDVVASGYKAQQNGSVWEVVEESSTAGGGSSLPEGDISEIKATDKATAASDGSGTALVQDKDYVLADGAVNFTDDYLSTFGGERTVTLTINGKKYTVKATGTKPTADDQTAADAAAKLIDALPAEVTLDNADAVAAARAAYDKLTPVQQKLVPATTYAKLTAAEGTITYLNDVAAAKAATTKITKLKNVKAKKAKVTYKKVKTVTGYQVKYGLNKKVTKKAKTKTIKKATTGKVTLKKLKKGKTYYFKVRTYTEITNPATGAVEKVYGKWSAVKKVKIKK